MKSFIGFIFITAMLGVSVLGYFGLVPFVSVQMGVTKPKDLV